MHKNFISGSMQRLFVSVAILCIVGIVLIGGYSWSIMTDTLFDQVEKTSLVQMQRANGMMNELLKKVENCVSEIRGNSAKYRDPQIAATTDVNSLLASAVDDETMGGCFLITSDGREYSYNPGGIHVDTVQLKIFCKFMPTEAQRSKWYNGSGEDFIVGYDDYYIVSTSLYDNREIYADVYIFVNKAEIDKILESMRDRNNIAILMNKGYFLAASDEKRLEEIRKSTKDILFELYESETGFFEFEEYSESFVTSHFQGTNGEFKFLAVYETADIYKECYKVLAVMFAIMATFILIVIGMYFLIKKQYINPFNQLVEQMKNTENNLTGEYIEIRGTGEVKVLVKQYNEMRRKIYSMLENVKNQEELKREAEVAALRYQINPHFFYNTLSNIKMLALSKGQHEISATISKFANMYRYLFSNKGNFVKLSEEVDFIKNYISLMSTRYDNRLNTFYMIDEQLTDCTLPIFVLQPIVENAIVHGLSKKLNEKEECFLRIIVTSEANELVIEIHDNGCGMSDEMVQKIMSIKDTENQEFGLGLFNTIKRLKYQYGNQYDFYIESAENEYTKVVMRIPLETQ